MLKKAAPWSAFNGRHVEEKALCLIPFVVQLFTMWKHFPSRAQAFQLFEGIFWFHKICSFIFTVSDKFRLWPFTSLMTKTNYMQLKVLTTSPSPLQCDATMKNPFVRPCYQNLKFSFPLDNFLAMEPRLQRIKRSSGCVSGLESLWEGLEKGRSLEKLPQVLSRKKKKC